MRTGTELSSDASAISPEWRKEYEAGRIQAQSKRRKVDVLDMVEQCDDAVDQLNHFSAGYSLANHSIPNGETRLAPQWILFAWFTALGLWELIRLQGGKDLRPSETPLGIATL